MKNSYSFCMKVSLCGLIQAWIERGNRGEETSSEDLAVTRSTHLD